MVEITMGGAEISVANDPARGARALIAEDRASGIRIVLPMDRLAAVTVGKALMTGLVVADPKQGKDN